ncbi:hypothetical protein [Nocardiopsis deserti]|uniref:hypothetical protein n=1 Tax=Nocardiopsis deserti TaxID=2605988 RepID=UPI00123AB837|nr:hypothetical protein [Nocardiopsis deserti]
MGDLFQGLTSIPAESLRLITLLGGMVLLNSAIGAVGFINERMLLAAAKIKESIKQSPEKILQQELEHTRFKVEEQVETTRQPIETHRERILAEARKIDVASEVVTRAKNHADNFGPIKEILDGHLKAKKKEEKQKKQNSTLARKANQTNGPTQKRNSHRKRR